MKNILFAVIFFGGIIITSCNNQPKEDKSTEAIAATTTDTVIKFTAAMVDNKRDPSCGMPVAAGIEDTVHYKGKILGFCSQDCKNDFLKNPEKGITAADLKK